MTQTVNVPGVGQLNFPDGMSEPDMAAAIKKNYPQIHEPGFIERLGTAFLKGMPAGPIGMVAGAAGEGLSSANRLLDKAAYSAGGGATDLATNLGASPEVAAGIGTTVNTGIQAIPMALGGQAAKMTSPMFEAAGKSLMQSALKPTIKALRTGEAATAIDTMLSEGVNATMGGVAKLRNKISELNRQIIQAIQGSPATVDKMKVAQTILPVFDRFKKQVNPSSDLTAIKSAWDDFINHPMLTSNQIPVQTAQELKQGTYRALAGKYGEMGSASTEAQKALARGLKEEIASAVPQISGLNAQESKLISALNVAERRALIDANKNPAGLAWLSSHPASFAAFVADRSPLFKSLVARMVYSGSEQIPANAARLGIGAATIGNQQELQ